MPSHGLFAAQIDKIRITPENLPQSQPKPTEGMPPSSISVNELFQVWRKSKSGRKIVLSMRNALPQDDRKKQRRDANSPTGTRAAVMHAPNYRFEVMQGRKQIPLVYKSECRKVLPSAVVPKGGVFSISSRCAHVPAASFCAHHTC
jgi:hypothetical protein